MKKLTLIALLMMASNLAQAKDWEKVKGMSALRDHSINQYDDSGDPPQAFDITLPDGYSLVAADVESGGSTVCSVTHLFQVNHVVNRLTIEALVIETDAGGCTVTLTVRGPDKKESQVKYSIEQTGT